MSNNNLELALRVRADVAQAMRQLNTLVDEIEQTGQATQQAQQQSQRATTQTTQAVREQARALDDVSDSLDLDSSIRQTERLGDAMDDTARSTRQNIDINQRMEDSLRSLTPHFVALIGLSGGLMTATMNALEKSSQLKNLSTISGMNVEQFQYYASGAKSVGIEMDKLSDIFKDTRDKVGDFLVTGGGELQDFFEVIAPKVGVTAEQFRHLSGADALQLYVDSLRKANVSENEMIFYMESIADEASALLPLLNQGGEGFKKYGEQAKQAGAILSQSTVEEAIKAKSAISSFQQEMQGVGNRIIVNMIPAIQFVSQHFDTLAKAGIIVASVFAGRMASSFILTTVEMIKVQATTMATAVAQARLGEVSLLTATRLNALALASRLLTASGGLIGLGVAIASTIAGFLLMRKSSDQVSDSLGEQKKTVGELKKEYDALSQSQQRMKEREQIAKVDELTESYHKQYLALAGLSRVVMKHSEISDNDRKQAHELAQAYATGRISAEEYANGINKLSSVSQELKTKIDQQAGATTTAKSKMDEANNVLATYQGKANLATSASDGLANGIGKIGTQAEDTKNKIVSLSREYQDLMKQSQDELFELSMANELIQKYGYDPDLAKELAKQRRIKDSDLTKQDIDLTKTKHDLLKQQEKLIEKEKEKEKKSEKKSDNKSKSTAPRVVGIVGDTGIGDTHLDIRRGDGTKPTTADLDRFRANGKRLTDYPMTSGYGHRNLKDPKASKFHRGLDFAIPKLTPVTTTVPIKDIKKWYDQKGGGYVSTITFEDGLVMKLLHQDPSMQQKVQTGASSGKGSSSNSNSSAKEKPKYIYTPAELKAMQKVQGLVRGSELNNIAQQHGVPVEYLEALMMQESKGDQYARSHKNALGYFQTTSIFRKQWKLTEQDSYDLIKSGTATIKSLAQAYKHFGNWEDALRSHNAGVAGTEQFNKTGKVGSDKARNKEVAEYVPKIARWSAWFGNADLEEQDTSSGKQHLQFIQAQQELKKQAEEEAKKLAEKREELLYQFASEPIKLKTDYDKKVSEIKSAGFDEQTQTQLLKQAEQEYQDKLTKRPEILQRALDNVKTLEQDFMQSTKTEHGNNLYQIEHKYDDLLNDIKTLRELAIDPQQQKDLDDAEYKIRVIIDKEKLKAEYDNAMSELDKLQAEKQQRLDILQQRYDSSNMTAHEFHTQKTAIDEDINPKLKDLAYDAQQLAYQLNDAFSVEKLNLFIAGLTQAQANFQQFLPTAEQLNDRITNGLTDAFFAFADGTKSAEEAFREFASTFFREIAQMILKQMIFNAISTAGKTGGGGWGGAIAGVIGSAFGGKGYSSGGYTGAGGKYEPAGIVHRDEFVIRKEMTNQVGAKEFLANFNRYGMNAIKGLQGYSSGGLVGAVPNITTPQVQAPKLVSPSEKIAQSTSFNANQNFYLVDDPSRILDTLNSSQGQENLVVMMSRDPEKFKTALKIG